MNFGWAIEQLKAGNKVTRKGWNGKGMYLWLMPAATVKAEWCKEPVLKAQQEKADKVDRIVCAVSEIAQFADDLAEGASEQLDIKVDKRDILIAIVDAVIHADEAGMPVKELIQNAYEKALKKAKSDHA